MFGVFHQLEGRTEERGDELVPIHVFIVGEHNVVFADVRVPNGYVSFGVHAVFTVIGNVDAVEIRVA